MLYMQTYELQAWLGDDHGLTDDQIEKLRSAATDIAARYPDEYDADDRDAAMIAAHRLLTEDPDLLVGELAAVLIRARMTQARALAGLQQIAATVVRVGDRGARGIESQSGFAEAASVDRMTVRRWCGQR